MFVKHFVRFNTRQELDDYDVIEFFDIVQSVVPAKVVQAVSVDGNKVSADVLIYDDEDADGPIYIQNNTGNDFWKGNKISAMLGSFGSGSIYI